MCVSECVKVSVCGECVYGGRYVDMSVCIWGGGVDPAPKHPTHRVYLMLQSDSGYLSPHPLMVV